ncbi:peptidoglycan-associated lipoprotein [Rhodanobacter soli]|jgi:peptidoglycan-associated lipoprotein|uniref:Peptidoglycan-associated lipoprotein n=2 Tax=Rhodanobacter soli TaxID=590609 RepID=A0ABV2PZ35_9GAMM
MLNRSSRAAGFAVALAAVTAMAGCSNYVKRTDYDAAISKLQSNDAQMQQQLDSLKADMEQRFAKYDATLTEMQGRLRVDTVAHFEFNKADLNDQDKAMLQDFAQVMKAHHSNAVVTVEGFTDPAGSSAYNKRLGQKRADAVRDYLVSTEGMSDTQVRAVSYGESRNRQVEPGATRESGSNNRRVALVVDYAG